MIAAILFVAYLSSYYVWSRLAMAEARTYEFEGYFFVKGTSDWYWVHAASRRIYSPLIAIDRWCGVDLGPASGGIWTVTGSAS